MLPKQSLKTKAFTLIEIMVVISIIALLSAGSLVAFNNLREKRLVRGDADLVIQELKKARTKARSGEKPEACLSDLEGYEVEVSGPSVILRVSCGNTIEHNTVQMQNSSIVGTEEVEFDALGGATPATIYVCGSNSLYGYAIEVTGSGLIESPVEYSGCS